MKIAAGILLLVLSTVSGYIFSLKYSERKKTFEKVLAFNSAVKNEVVFSKKSLVSIVKNTETDCSLIEYIRSFFLDKNVKEDKLKILTKSEKDFFTEYVKGLGQGDKKSQTEFLHNSETRLKSFLSDAAEADKKYRPLCVKLGFLFGLIVLIILL